MEIDIEKVKQLRMLVQKGGFVIAGHALSRMSERCIRVEDAVNAILNGNCFAQEQPDGDRPPRFHFASRDRSITVIVAADLPVCIVTVFFET